MNSAIIKHTNDDDPVVVLQGGFAHGRRVKWDGSNIAGKGSITIFVQTPNGTLMATTYLQHMNHDGGTHIFVAAPAHVASEIDVLHNQPMLH